MKKLLPVLIGLLLLALPAFAEPMVTAGGYTAYLGEGSYMYLQDPLGATKVLRHPIADIVAIADDCVYAVAQDGRLFAIRLDGTKTTVLADNPTQADVAAVAPGAVFELTDGTLYALRPDGSKLLAATAVTAAAANEDRLFFITQTQNGVSTLKAVQLSSVSSADSRTPVPTMLGMGVEAPVSMTATADALAIVDQQRNVIVISLIDMMRHYHAAVSQVTERAVCIGTEVLRYTKNDQGWWLLEADEQLPTLTFVDPASAVRSEPTATPTPTIAPTRQPTPTPTQRPTATPEPEEAYPRLEYGSKGSAVRNLQRRLKTLGYPVGKVDGTWGKNTQLAVNLFQCALGWRERDYASSAMQEKLYSRSAPQYDPYAPLREGDEGTDVMLMQQALFDLGYLGTDEEEEVDGRYGPITTQAIRDFQSAVGYQLLYPTGYADADTLMVLFSEDAPRNPALSQPTDPNYPEFILPGTPGNPVVPPATSTDLVVSFTPDN